MLSNTCKAAVKAVIYLATQSESGRKSSVIEIAQYIGASEHTVGKLLQTLVKQQVINSLKGPSGGFYINDQQFKQPIINIVYAIDGSQLFKECGLGLSKCSSAHPCPIHDEYQKAREIIASLFQHNEVRTLCAPVASGLAYLMD